TRRPVFFRGVRSAGRVGLGPGCDLRLSVVERLSSRWPRSLAPPTPLLSQSHTIRQPGGAIAPPKTAANSRANRSPEPRSSFSGARPALCLQSGPRWEGTRGTQEWARLETPNCYLQLHCVLALVFAKEFLNPQPGRDRNEQIQHLLEAKRYPRGDCKRAKLPGSCECVSLVADSDSVFASQ